MPDLLMILLGVVGFLACAVFVRACEKLQEPRP
jgi:hypothetical protein